MTDKYIAFFRFNAREIYDDAIYSDDCWKYLNSHTLDDEIFIIMEHDEKNCRFKGEIDNCIRGDYVN